MKTWGQYKRFCQSRGAQAEMKWAQTSILLKRQLPNLLSVNHPSLDSSTSLGTIYFSCSSSYSICRQKINILLAKWTPQRMGNIRPIPYPDFRVPYPKIALKYWLGDLVGVRGLVFPGLPLKISPFCFKGILSKFSYVKPNPYYRFFCE